MPRGGLRPVPLRGLGPVVSAWLDWAQLAKGVLAWLASAFRALCSLLLRAGLCKPPCRVQPSPLQPWEGCPERRVYRASDGGEELLTVHTNPYSFQRRRHFSTAVVGHHIYAIGGWYLDSLLAPDNNTSLYTAVERYNPWSDRWAFVASLPMGDFSFSVSLSHDLPLCTAHGGCIYALGNVQHTGEKLLLCYHVATDTWQELLPTLTRADVNLPGLYFLGGTDPLYVVGGNTQENVVTPFSLCGRQWGPARALPKWGLAGQGLSWEGKLYMASPDLGAVLEVDLGVPDCRPLPPPPFPLFYEAFFLLYFPPAGPGGVESVGQEEEEEEEEEPTRAARASARPPGSVAHPLSILSPASWPARWSWQQGRGGGGD